MKFWRLSNVLAFCWQKQKKVPIFSERRDNLPVCIISPNADFPYTIKNRSNTILILISVGEVSCHWLPLSIVFPCVFFSNSSSAS